MVEWFERKIINLDELPDDEEKTNILEEIRIKLRSLTTLELYNTASNMDLTRLFKQLNSDNRAYIEEICSNLSTLFNALEPGEIIKRYPDEISQFIHHPESQVRSLVLKELLRTASSPEKVTHLIDDVNLLNLIVEQIGSDDLAVAKLSMDIIKEVGKKPAGSKTLYSSILLRSLAKLISKGGIVGFRVYEIVVDIAKSSEDGLEASATSGFLNSLINVLKDDNDVLLQLNALEVLADLASTNYGLDYLEDRDVLKELSDKISRADQDPLSTLLIPGLMKFFGKILKTRVDIFSKYPTIITALFQVINDTDDTILLANAIDTLGNIASTPDGKYALKNFGQFMDNALDRISYVIKKMPSELKIRGLDCLALMINVDKEQQNNQIVSLTCNWFKSLDDEPLDVIVGLCRQPFLDIKISSYRVLAAVSNQAWGHELIASYPGLVELLLERSNDSGKIIKEIKYDIVKNLAEASIDTFDSGTLQKFQTFIRQGPFYVDLEMDVAVEGAV